ncbi:hypothetical protein ACI2L1_19420 [Streptomyces sp. NPDC019531]|uniref:hypothetical protein n=1 Tax=Streptomyces sp. NPDC019531 TaxID=3365062 RepID=UPI00384B768F
MRRAGISYLPLLAVGAAARPAPRRPGDGARRTAADLGRACPAWSAYRAERTEAASAQTPEAVADRLAVAVRHEWDGDAEVRRLAEPYPLPVGRRDADRDLAEAPGPYSYGGRRGELAAVFTERMPTRRLLVLGDPGSGKPLLLVRILLPLIERRRAGDPVPVLFPPASRDPIALDLRDRMERRLVRDHGAQGWCAELWGSRGCGVRRPPAVICGCSPRG